MNTRAFRAKKLVAHLSGLYLFKVMQTAFVWLAMPEPCRFALLKYKNTLVREETTLLESLACLQTRYIARTTCTWNIVWTWQEFVELVSLCMYVCMHFTAMPCMCLIGLSASICRFGFGTLKCRGDYRKQQWYMYCKFIHMNGERSSQKMLAFPH